MRMNINTFFYLSIVKRIENIEIIIWPKIVALFFKGIVFL